MSKAASGCLTLADSCTTCASKFREVSGQAQGEKLWGVDDRANTTIVRERRETLNPKP